MTMPLPTRPGHVHCYLLPVDGGYLLVDTGLGLPDAADRVGGGARRGSTRPSSTIFLTHFHPDHLGAAADVRELTGAPGLQGRVDAEQAALVWGRRRAGRMSSRTGSTSNGVPGGGDRGADRAGPLSTGRSSGRCPIPSSSTTDDGLALRLGARRPRATPTAS